MSNNQIADRLARGVREAKKSAQAQSPSESASSRSATRNPPGKPPVRSEQTPSPTLDRPWENLHPARIWPD